MKKEIIEWIKTIAISIVIAFVITTFIRPVVVDGMSMYPTLDDNDYLISEITHKINKGDIIAFKSQIPFSEEELNKFNFIQRIKVGKTRSLIKRVIAISGDEVRIQNGKVYVNNKKLEEDYIDNNYTSGDIYIENIPEGKIFVMGDNHENSLDSRIIGMVDIEDIQGKVFIRILPLSKFRIIE